MPLDHFIQSLQLGFNFVNRFKALVPLQSHGLNIGVLLQNILNQLEDGLKLSTVRATKVVGNKCFAFAFAEGEGLKESLLVFELDPNGDRCFDDAKLANTIEVGASELEGHFGHHGIAFLGNRKTAVVTNPGDGTLSVIDLVTQKVIQTVGVGGQPTHLICYGETM